MEKKDLDRARKTNEVSITGKIVSTKDLEPKTSKAGEEYLSGSITMKCVIDGVDNYFDVEVYQKRNKKDGTPSVLFDTYLGLANKVGCDYTVNGSLVENRFVDKKTNTLASSYRISGQWFNPAKINETNKATFKFSGFVNKPITERKTKEGALICYDLEIGQASYNDDKMSIFKFQIDPNNIAVVQGVSMNYAVGTTVSFTGNLSCIIEQRTVEEKKGFGASEVKTFTNTVRRFWITGGDMPIMDGSQYGIADIQTLRSAYAQKDLELTTAANVTASAGMTPSGSAPVSSRQSSLI